MPQTSPTPAAISSPAEIALALAREAHAGQRRKQSGEPFVEHPIAVVQLLTESEDPGDTVVAAAYLHDVVEKTALGTEEIAERCGDQVAELVEALTEDGELEGYEQRKTLYNLYHVLNHLNLFGAGYLDQAERMIRALSE